MHTQTPYHNLYLLTPRLPSAVLCPQVVDTVHLFWIPGSRRLSLRFLAWHLLGEQMANRMADQHDSIEGAQTALALYKKYLELQEAGSVDDTIDHLYDLGRDTNWVVP